MINKPTQAGKRARSRAKYLTGILWHAAAYIIIGTFLMVLDLLGPGWLNWSIWILGFWGFALAFHTVAYLIMGRNLEKQFREQFEQVEH